MKHGVEQAGSLAFVWDNFGPLHVDRCEEVARHFGGRRSVIGLELSARSQTYDWLNPPAIGFTKETLFGSIRTSEWSIYWRLVNRLLHHKVSAVFFCHYQRPAILAAAWTMRLLGKHVFSLNDSKFDDYRRYLWREIGKWFFFSPYLGAIAASPRCSDYLRFLGVPENRIVLGVYALSADRIRGQLGSDFVPPEFAKRTFTVISRLVRKKNIVVALEAFALLPQTIRARRLLVCGSGPLEGVLKARAVELGIAKQVEFHGFVQSEGISKILGSTLALLLPSVEEQFGQVVEEAQAVGVPVILSPQCGAADELVRSAVHGFVCEADNPGGLAWMMSRLSEDEALWTRMSSAALANEALYGIRRFSAAVEALLGSK